MSAHDTWLANYRRYTTEVWCSTPACPHHEDSVEVTYESEYGQGWYTPEECDCGGRWLEDRPAPEVPRDPQLSDEENMPLNEGPTGLAAFYSGRYS